MVHYTVGGAASQLEATEKNLHQTETHNLGIHARVGSKKGEGEEEGETEGRPRDRGETERQIEGKRERERDRGRRRDRDGEIPSRRPPAR